MNQREEIIRLLKLWGRKTQGELAYSMYRDKQHGPYIYAALMKLVDEGIVIRQGDRPAYYSLADGASIAPTPAEKEDETIDEDELEELGIVIGKKKELRDISNDIISNETLDEAWDIVRNDKSYGPEMALVRRCFRKYPLNTDSDLVAMKMGLIDITNSTHLSQHKSHINMSELSKIIANIPNIDERLSKGDPTLVNEIARSNGEINLFSFASKYCCYHNHEVYGRDDYSILDTVVKVNLPRYFPDVKRTEIQKWQNTLDYRTYNDFITNKLIELGITTEYRKRKLDYFIWFKNR